MLAERDEYLGRASCVLATEAASAFGCHDLTAPTERDLQRLVGNTIDKTIADAIIDRNHPHLVQFAINSATTATVAVLRTVPSTPPLLTIGSNPPARTRLAGGLPLDTATLHVTFGHAPRGALRTTWTCTTSNMRKAPTYRPSGSPTQHTPGSSGSGDLVGPVHTQSRTGAVNGLHLAEHNTHYVYFSGLRSKSGALSEIET